MNRSTSFYHKESELMQACRVLYGPETIVDHHFLRILQPKELKTAYRKRALATHPDFFLSQDGSLSGYSGEQFIAVSEAYQKLNRYLRERAFLDSANLSPKSGGRYSNASPAPFDFSNAQGRYSPFNWNFSFAGKETWQKSGVVLPRWRLKIGEFLCYSKIIGWNDLACAIAWQRKCRPKIGEIAARWRWVSPQIVQDCIRRKARGEKTGEMLLRHEIITPFQLGMLLRFQAERQPLIGQYFVQRGLVDQCKVTEYLGNLYRHNVSILPK